MLRFAVLTLICSGTLGLAVSEVKDDQLSELLNREEKLEGVVEKLTGFVDKMNALDKAKEVKADAAPEYMKAEAVIKTQDDELAQVRNREQRLEHVVEKLVAFIDAKSKSVDAKAEDEDQDERVSESDDKTTPSHGKGILDELKDGISLDEEVLNGEDKRDPRIGKAISLAIKVGKLVHRIDWSRRRRRWWGKK